MFNRKALKTHKDKHVPCSICYVCMCLGPREFRGAEDTELYAQSYLRGLHIKSHGDAHVQIFCPGPDEFTR